MRDLVLIDEQQLPESDVFGRDIKLNHYQRFLGTALKDVYYDASHGLYCNAFAAIAGAISDHNHLYLCLPNHINVDPDHSRMLDWGNDIKQCTPFFNQRLLRINDKHQLDRKLYKTSNKPLIENFNNQIYLGKRGRGKSTALKNKVQWLLNQQIQPIIVISPYRSNRQQFEALSGQSQSQIIFAPPDKILAKKPDAQYLIIDEAAAIPAQQLIALLTHYPRFTLASTTDGYEGSANHFSIKTLNNPIFKDVKPIHFEQSFRFQEADKLESKINQIFLINQHLNQTISSNGPLQIEKISRDLLFNNEDLLKKIWFLLRQSHYRNQPEDLKRLLDLPFQTLYIARIADNIIGVLHLLKETALNDDQLIQAIIDRKRRPQGRILMQQLLMRTGNYKWAKNDLYRIHRIAVDQNHRRQKIASKLIQTAIDDLKSIIGTIFADDPALNVFWESTVLENMNNESNNKNHIFIHRPNF